MKNQKIITTCLLMLIATSQASARQSYFSAFNALYPEWSGTFGQQCNACHISFFGSGTRNDYGNAFSAIGNHFIDPTGVILSLENIDSDNDGVNNVDEILAGFNPGLANSTPPQASANLLIEINVAPHLVSVGNGTWYELSVTNLGPDTAADINLTVLDDFTLSAVGVVTDASGDATDAGNCTGPELFGTCTYASLESNASVTERRYLSFFSTGGPPTGSASITATVNANTNDPDSVNNSIIGSVSIRATTSPVLLVNDSHSVSGDIDTYITALDNLGVAYDLYDTNSSTFEPLANVLANYSTVIWMTGTLDNGVNGNEGPLSATEPGLTSFLQTNDTCLIIMSPEYLSHTAPLNAFQTDTLGIDASGTLGESTYTSATGTGLADALGSLSITTSSPLPDFVPPDNTAGSLMLNEAGTSIAIKKNLGTSRTSVWGFDLNYLASSQDQSDVLGAALSHGCSPESATNVSRIMLIILNLLNEVTN